MPTTEELLNQRNQIQNTMNQTLSPVSNNDMYRYLNDKVQGFQPLIQEQQSLNTQAANTLPQQIQDYTKQRQMPNWQGADAMTMLSSIIGNQNRLRGTADMYNSILEGVRGRLSNITNDAMSMLGQEQQRQKGLFDVANQDYNSQLGYDRQAAEAQKQRDFQAKEAAKSRAASAAAAKAAYASSNPNIDKILAQLKGANQAVSTPQSAIPPQAKVFQDNKGNIQGWETPERSQLSQSELEKMNNMLDNYGKNSPTWDFGQTMGNMQNSASNFFNMLNPNYLKNKIGGIGF